MAQNDGFYAERAGGIRHGGILIQKTANDECRMMNDE
jgi:hypothetical protein